MSNIVFKQLRIGCLNKPFYIYKLRTMDEKGHSNRWQYFLRKTGIDELPQIINILKGDMVLVAPRPLTPEDHKKYRKFALPCKPGITGWWQIHGRNRNQIHRLDLDYFYLKKKLGVLVDLYILWRTIPLVLFRKHG